MILHVKLKTRFLLAHFRERGKFWAYVAQLIYKTSTFEDGLFMVQDIDIVIRFSLWRQTGLWANQLDRKKYFWRLV